MPHHDNAVEYRAHLLRCLYGGQAKFAALPPEAQREIFALYEEAPEVVSRVFGGIRGSCPDC